MKNKILIIALFCLLVSCQSKRKIACIGDSITEGAGIQNQSRNAYPAVLQKLLGEKYQVLNAGRSGATMLKQSDLPYWNCNEFANVFAFKPKCIIIQLGTNDSKIHNWKPDAYEKDFQSMIDTLNLALHQPKIFVCLPVPAFKMQWAIDDSVISNQIIPIIKKLETKNQFQLIDLHTALKENPNMFPDGIHPNEAGAEKMARVIAKVIKKE
ncbi:MAG: GDSL-type esterase/lipase family protein [Bacteroidia bacterium]